MSKVPYPNYEDILRESHEMAASHPELATYSEIGKSEEGRPLPLLTITDPAIPATQKSVFLLSGGTDGSEEVGRAVALGLARALLQTATADAPGAASGAGGSGHESRRERTRPG